MDTSKTGVPAKIYAAAIGLGATQEDIHLLLGLAAAESNFKVDAVGDIGLPSGPRYGLFQKETDKGLGLAEQVESAWGLMQDHMKELRRLGQKPWTHLCATGKRDKWRYVRCAWQSKRERLTRWLTHLKSKFDGSLFIIRAALPMLTAPADLEKAQHALVVGEQWHSIKQREDAWDVKLKVKALIHFAKTEGADDSALTRGQTTFDSFMSKTGWAPADALRAKAEEGEGAPASSVWGKTDDAWGDKTPEERAKLEELGNYPKSMAGYMRWAWDQVAGGGKSFALGAVKTLLPIAGIALAGGVAYVAIRNAIRAGVSTDDAEVQS